MKKHSVAVLLATYNGAKYIREFLDSLVAQTYADFKMMVRDDGSTDGTLEIIRSYSPRIEIAFIEANVRLGPAKSFFELLTHAGDDYDFYFFADQDDCWHKSKINRAVAALATEKELVALYCSRMDYVDENLRHISYSRVPRRLAFENALVENIATGCTVAINQTARQLILTNLPNKVIMHDWWIYLIAMSFGKVIYDEFPTIKYRQHDSNVLGASTNLLQDMQRKFARFVMKDGGVFSLTSQAEELMRCFSWRMSKQQLASLSSLTDAKNGFFLRLKLAINPVFFRQSRFDSIILKLLFILGRF